MDKVTVAFSDNAFPFNVAVTVSSVASASSRIVCGFTDSAIAVLSGSSGSSGPQLTTPALLSMPSNHLWKAASVGAHNCVASSHSPAKLVRRTNDDGRAPDKALLESRINRKSVRLPTDGGSSPENRLD